MEEALKFRKGDRIKIEGEFYQVLGGIEMVNRSDGARWTEYYVQNLQNGKLRWLSVDEVYDEYALYTSCGSAGFQEEELDSKRWKNADSGVEEVLGWFGDVDAEQGEKASYTEYQDSTGEWIMSVEHWDGESEYSKGYYLDKDEIEISSDLQKIENPHFRVDYNNCQPRQPRSVRNRTGAAKKIIAVVVIAIIMAWGIWAITSSASKKEIRNYLKIEDLALQQKGEFLTQDNLQGIFLFGKDEISKKENMEVNSLSSPKLLQYYPETEKNWE